jgi:hypothetical protein
MAAIVVAERRACAVMSPFDRNGAAEVRPVNFKVVTWTAVATTLSLLAAI